MAPTTGLRRVLSLSRVQLPPRLELKGTRLDAKGSEVAVVLGERLARYGFRRRPSVRARSARRLPARIRAARTRCSGCRARAARCADRRSSSCFTLPSTCASSWSARRAAAAGWMRGDTPAFRGVFEAAAVRGRLEPRGEPTGSSSGTRRRAFVPIGGLHHAARERAAGFCVFNDCGVVIEYLRREHGMRRIAYVDIDAHHGDGVFYAFEDDPESSFADLHESGQSLYPGTGARRRAGSGAGRGHQAQCAAACRRGRCRIRGRSGRRCSRMSRASTPSS